jgi:hypothetical protein
MTRYKGRQNAKAVEKDFPHFVILPSRLGASHVLTFNEANFFQASAKLSHEICGCMK